MGKITPSFTCETVPRRPRPGPRRPGGPRRPRPGPCRPMGPRRPRPVGKDKSKIPRGRGGKVVKKAKKFSGKKRVPNMFILYFMEMYKKHGGNMYCVAKECGRRWRNMSAEEKDTYKRLYCAKCKACKSCKRSSGAGTSGGGSDKTGNGKKSKKC